MVASRTGETIMKIFAFVIEETIHEGLKFNVEKFDVCVVIDYISNTVRAYWSTEIPNHNSFSEDVHFDQENTLDRNGDPVIILEKPLDKSRSVTIWYKEDDWIINNQPFTMKKLRENTEKCVDFTYQRGENKPW